MERLSRRKGSQGVEAVGRERERVEVKASMGPEAARKLV
jgi:hypothetical protein